MRTLALTMLTIGMVCVLDPHYADATASVKGHHRHSSRHVARSYAPPAPPIQRRAAPYNQNYEPYYGASQGYAPGEKEQFLYSLRRSL
jgi:hypothetical protein